MERLSGMDAGLLYMETPTVFTHTIKVAVFEPGPDAYSFERARDEIERCTRLLPQFRRRLRSLPLAFHHPLWVDAADFDIDEHVFREKIAPPGGSEQLDEAVSRIAGSALDRSRPMWEIWLLEGLSRGRMAAVVKIHHALADGMAAARLFATVLGATPEDRTGDVPLPAVEPPPSTLRLLGDAAADHVRRFGRLPSLIGRTASGLARARRAPHPSGEAPVPRPMLDVPRTILNAALTTRRTFVSGELDLADVKSVKKSFGVTVNDVLLSVVAGSVRRHLAIHDSLPDGPLVVEIPVGTDVGENEQRTVGNRTSNIFAYLRTDIAEPVDRLLAIYEATQASKRAHDLLGAQMYGDWSEYAPPGLYMGITRMLSRYRLADRMRPGVNLIVSTVPGPRSPLYFDGARLAAIYSVGPILDGIGLNVTLWSYMDRICIGALSCPDLFDDLREIVSQLAPELAVLKARAASGADPTGEPNASRGATN